MNKSKFIYFKNITTTATIKLIISVLLLLPFPFRIENIFSMYFNLFLDFLSNTSPATISLRSYLVDFDSFSGHFIINFEIHWTKCSRFAHVLKLCEVNTHIDKKTKKKKENRLHHRLNSTMNRQAHVRQPTQLSHTLKSQFHFFRCVHVVYLYDIYMQCVYFIALNRVNGHRFVNVCFCCFFTYFGAVFFFNFFVLPLFIFFSYSRYFVLRNCH